MSHGRARLSAVLFFAASAAPSTGLASRRISTTSTSSPSKSVWLSVGVPPCEAGALRSVTFTRGTLARPHSTGMMFQVRTSSPPGRRTGIRPLRRPASTKPSVVSNSSCTTMLAERDCRWLRMTRRMGTGTWRLAVVGTSSKAMSPSRGGFKEGRRKVVTDSEP